MSAKMQNLVFFMEPSENAYNTSLKAGNMILNRFYIDEGAAFELTGVYYLEKTSVDIEDHLHIDDNAKMHGLDEFKRNEKGKESSF